MYVCVCVCVCLFVYIFHLIYTFLCQCLLRLFAYLGYCKIMLQWILCAYHFELELSFLHISTQKWNCSIIVAIQSLSCVRLFATPCTAACVRLFRPYNRSILLLFFWGSSILLSIITVPIYSPPTVHMGSFILQPHQCLLFVVFVMIAILTGWGGVLYWLWSSFPWWLAKLSILSHVYWPSGCLLWKNIYLGLLPIFNGVVWIVWCGVVRILLYSCPLNNTDLNCVGPLLPNFFQY